MCIQSAVITYFLEGRQSYDGFLRIKIRPTVKRHGHDLNRHDIVVFPFGCITIGAAGHILRIFHFIRIWDGVDAPRPVNTGRVHFCPACWGRVADNGGPAKVSHIRNRTALCKTMRQIDNGTLGVAV